MLTTEQRGLFDTLDFSQFSCSIPDFVLCITVVSHFTGNYSRPVPKIGSSEKIQSRFRKDEEILVLEVISSVSYTQVLSDGADEHLCGTSEPSVKTTGTSRSRGWYQASPLENKPDKRASVRRWWLKDLTNYRTCLKQSKTIHCITSAEKYC